MLRRILLLCVVFPACAAGWAQSFHYKKLEDVNYEWAGQPLRFLVERQLEVGGGGEPEAAPARLQVLRDGKPIAMFDLQWGVTQFRGEYANQATFPENLAKSRYLLFVNISSSKPPILMAFGTAVGDVQGPVYAYGLDADGKPHQLLAQEEFGFAKLADVGRTGEVKIITPKCTQQGASDVSAPYDPYLVWRVKDNSVDLDKSLTQRYNQQNYVWSGMECRDDVMVVKGKDGKLRLKKTSEVVREPGEEVHDATAKPH